jgi:hypothetical protein
MNSRVIKKCAFTLVWMSTNSGLKRLPFVADQYPALIIRGRQLGCECSQVSIILKSDENTDNTYVACDDSHTTKRQFLPKPGVISRDCPTEQEYQYSHGEV